MGAPSQSSHSQSSVGPRRAVLAIDYGRRRIGLALSDESGLIARPLSVLSRTNRRQDIVQLRELCRTHGVGSIVVGLPLHLDGTPGTLADEAARFAERLRKQLGLPVDLLDERLSSWEAEQVISETGSREAASPRKRKALDDLAAAVILRDYLSRTARSARG